MKTLHQSAPLPFVGQKRIFVREYIKLLPQFDDKTIFLDLFGGSGLLSHITKHFRPDATVIYNDFDNYRYRLANIPQTNRLLSDIRGIVGDNVPRHKPITGKLRERIYSRIAQEEKVNGYVDYITLSSSLMFSMKYKTDLDGLRKETLYNNIRKDSYAECPDYLEGIEVTSCDYRHLYEKYKLNNDVVLLVDPPYLSTEVGTYTMKWRLADYLDVLTILADKPFVYFTSNKSSIIELCEWIGANNTIGNPFAGCSVAKFNAHMNYSSSYTDIMLYKTSGAQQQEAHSNAVTTPLKHHTNA